MKISKGVLKAKMLKYFSELESTSEELRIIDRRTSVQERLPIQVRKSWAEIFPERDKLIRIPEKSLLERETENWGKLNL